MKIQSNSEDDMIGTDLGVKNAARAWTLDYRLMEHGGKRGERS